MFSIQLQVSPKILGKKCLIRYTPLRNTSTWTDPKLYSLTSPKNILKLKKFFNPGQF